ncbi:cytochrome C oxidase subunit I [Chloroflexia bacterium SDU3-3]|nr:cytochrome C oxidase subunit I [Chloroflexia bacterium SDU3-3]
MQVASPLPQRQPSSLAFPKLAMLMEERTLVGAHVLTGMLALLLGSLMGPFQTFRRSPFVKEAFPDLQIPFFSFYYQALTIHGVMNALFFTTFFIVGFTYFITQRSLERPLWNRTLAWVSYAMMFVGLALVLFAIGSGQASVLYTFYPSLVAHPTFYIGLVLLVVGSWLVGANVFMTYAAWRKEHPGERVPLAVFAAIANFIMWIVATFGVAVEVLFMLLPLSLGWLKTTDPQMGRVLFWFFGHPLVYFWLIPAYISWYTMLPKQVGSKLFSDGLARVAFLMLVIFSVPVGVHHLFSDPGVSSVMKGIHTVFTFVVAVPSFLTAFNIGATLERAGRQRGARRALDWLWHQDFGNPVVAAQLAGMILFIAGGFSGIIQASLTLNIALHNTSWVPGHFHMTLAGAVTLTYIGIAYWIVPLIRNRALWSKKVALAQIYTWLVGMLIFGHGMGAAGIAGVPRRTDLSNAPYVNPDAAFFLNTSAISGVILLISLVLLLVNLVGTLFFSKEPVTEGAPVDTVGPAGSPLWLERWGLWVGIILVLAAVAWLPVVADALGTFASPGYTPFVPNPLK